MNKFINALVLVLVFLILGFWAFSVGGASDTGGEGKVEKDLSKLSIAIFAGGCFWCMQPPFDKLDGVEKTIVGYTAGHKENPTYQEVSAGTTGHTEGIQIFYDPNKLTYQKLLEVFWRNIDPYDRRGQFCDKGTEYRSGIYYHDEEQQKLAEASKKELAEDKGDTVVTEIEEFKKFYPAEDYHQDYYKKNPFRYKTYRFGCGRDRRLKEIWG